MANNLRDLALSYLERYKNAKHNTYLEAIGEKPTGENINAFECSISHMSNWYELEQELERLNNSSRSRIKRLKTRINDLLRGGDCVFLTLNFSDNTLERTSYETRREYVRKFLKQQNADFVANVDYGSNKVYVDKNGVQKQATEREHYHALISCGSVDYTGWHDYGGVRGEKVRLRKNSTNNLARYIDKLSLHAVKDSTRNVRLIYSKARKSDI